MKSIQITNEHGRTFSVVRVEHGEGYGRNGCVTNDSGQAIIEFIDITNGFKQTVSYYYAETLKDRTPSRDLQLDGGVPAWNLSVENMQQVTEALL